MVAARSGIRVHHRCYVRQRTDDRPYFGAWFSTRGREAASRSKQRQLDVATMFAPDWCAPGSPLRSSRALSCHAIAESDNRVFASVQRNHPRAVRRMLMHLTNSRERRDRSAVQILQRISTTCANSRIGLAADIAVGFVLLSAGVILLGTRYASKPMCGSSPDRTGARASAKR